MDIEDDYIAFCFDEACLYIESQLSKENGPRPRWADNKVVSSKPKNNSKLISVINGL